MLPRLSTEGPASMIIAATAYKTARAKSNVCDRPLAASPIRRPPATSNIGSRRSDPREWKTRSSSAAEARERLTIFSPRGAGMGPHVGMRASAQCRGLHDRIHRAARYTEDFSVCQLRSRRAPPANCIANGAMRRNWASSLQPESPTVGGSEDRHADATGIA